MIQAYILVQTGPGQAAAVAAAIAAVPGVALAEDVTGPYDVIVRVKAESVDNLGQFVFSNIQQVEGVTRTVTCPIVHI